MAPAGGRVNPGFGPAVERDRGERGEAREERAKKKKWCLLSHVGCFLGAGKCDGVLATTTKELEAIGTTSRGNIGGTNSHRVEFED